MQLHRLIPVILLKNGLIVRSQLFRIHQIIGNPMHTVRRLSNWNVDELILLDISKGEHHDMRRDDLQVVYAGSSPLAVLEQIAEQCFMPLTFGGRIRSVEDIRQRIQAGADKCAINSEAVRNPKLIGEAAAEFGSQCIVVSIDALRHDDGSLEVFIDDGKTATGLDPAEWASQCEELGAGEILVNSIDRDGSGWGYDLDLVSAVVNAVSVPVIACGGVGAYEHFAPAISEAGASAAAAANIFNFYELSYPLAKTACISAGVSMRAVSLGSEWFPREPEFDFARESKRIEDRLERARTGRFAAAENQTKRDVRWCTNCVYPSLSATPMEFDDNGLCMGCQMASMREDTPQHEWDRRRSILQDIVDAARSRDGSRHDCVIGVSGGKDSYFQTHFFTRELGLNPLLVTYYGNNYTPTGERNLRRMAEVFDVDHIIYTPGIDLLKKLNRLGFIIMGDMNWHNHIGIATLPLRIAVQNKIPLVVYGEHGYADLCGQFSMNDFVEWTYRNRLEHFARGYDWNYMVGREGITASRMAAYQYPSDQEIYETGLRAIYLGNYLLWDGNANAKLMNELYGFEFGDQPFERTYRRASNLDDMHENGAHDYLKFIKFGYGRCTDHASKDIRSGIMTRDEAIDLVEKHDPVRPSDIERWCAYVGMSEEEFDAIADTFRDPRVWWFANGKWEKQSIRENFNEQHTRPGKAIDGS
jgi:imidazoleglycerol phosphate synthase cyclase subunit